VSSKKRNTRSRLLALFMAGGLLLAACGDDTTGTPGASSPGSDGTKEPATLKVALDWFPNPDHVALYYALDNGFFDEQNLTVEFKTPSDVTAGL
jgi:putative hydroxymethylpyrimidine transport system substrate-binding protein